MRSSRLAGGARLEVRGDGGSRGHWRGAGSVWRADWTRPPERSSSSASLLSPLNSSQPNNLIPNFSLTHVTSLALSALITFPMAAFTRSSAVRLSSAGFHSSAHNASHSQSSRTAILAAQATVAASLVLSTVSLPPFLVPFVIFLSLSRDSAGRRLVRSWLWSWDPRR